MCSCDDYLYRQGDGFENGDMKPSELGRCKHVKSIKSEGGEVVNND